MSDLGACRAITCAVAVRPGRPAARDLSGHGGGALATGPVHSSPRSLRRVHFWDLAGRIPCGTIAATRTPPGLAREKPARSNGSKGDDSLGSHSFFERMEQRVRNLGFPVGCRHLCKCICSKALCAPTAFGARKYWGQFKQVYWHGAIGWHPWRRLAFWVCRNQEACVT